MINKQNWDDYDMRRRDNRWTIKREIESVDWWRENTVEFASSMATTRNTNYIYNNMDETRGGLCRKKD